MKTISVSVVEEDYEAFRRAAADQDRSIAQLIREAMRHYRLERLEARSRLEEIRTFGGRQIAPLPTKEQIWDEITEDIR